MKAETKEVLNILGKQPDELDEIITINLSVKTLREMIEKFKLNSAKLKELEDG